MAASVTQLPFRQSGGPARLELVVPSSFGLDHTTLGPEFDAKGLVDSTRVKELEYRERFFRCTQHDHKIFDMNGNMTRPGRIPGVQPLIGSNAPSFYVPLEMRRPNAPYRIGKKIVSSFTGMLFGRGRWPQVRSDDPVTQDWAEALVEAVKMRTKFIRARNIGGSCGTVGISWRFVSGKPRISIHHGKNIHVLEWEDAEEKIPRHVVELYQYSRRVFDERKKKHVERWFWHRRDWTPTADIFFEPVPVDKQNPRWVIDQNRSMEHNEDDIHFAYIENLPDDEPSCDDGVPDYAETYEQMNTLDVLNSVVVRGGVLNLDPTLVLKMEREELGGAIIRKGSDNALTVGPSGDAHYMELSGQSLTAGGALIDRQRDQILETSECVLVDPDRVAAAGTSSVALKVVYAPMLGKSDLLRDQYGEGIVRALEGLTRSARQYMRQPGAPSPEEEFVHVPVVDEETGQPVVDESTGTPIEEPVEYYVEMPPRIEKEPVIDEVTGEATGEVTLKVTERHPGTGRIWLEWGPYFKPTADDHSKDVTAASTAAGGKAVLSQQTAVELTAQSYDRDGTEEWARVQRDNLNRAAEEGGMFPDIGGAVQEEEEEPEGEEEPEEMPEAPPGE